MSGNLGDPIGQNIAHYVVERRIGGGAMASVYQATDQIFDRTIALKVLMPGADALTRQRFRQEARTVSILDHPNIVKTLQVGQTSADGVAYIAMDMVTGKSLSTLLDEQSTLSVGASCALLEPIARALAYAHSLGVIHRDVKPSNILLNKVEPTDEKAVPIYFADGTYSYNGQSNCEAYFPFLSDFGIARALDSPELTSAGRTIGTPAYMAPEQCAGSREIDGRADIYSLGTVLYRCLVGRPPFIGTTTQILHAHVYEPLMIPDDILSELPPSVIDALRRSLMKEPEYRYKDASEMADALATVSENYTGEFQAAIAAGAQPNPAEMDLAPTRTVDMMDSVGEQAQEDSGSTSHVLIPGPLPGAASTTEGKRKTGTATQTPVIIKTPGSTTHPRVSRPLPTASSQRRPNWIGWTLGTVLLLLLAFIGAALYRNINTPSPVIVDAGIEQPSDEVQAIVQNPLDSDTDEGAEPDQSGEVTVGDGSAEGEPDNGTNATAIDGSDSDNGAAEDEAAPSETAIATVDNAASADSESDAAAEQNSDQGNNSGSGTPDAQANTAADEPADEQDESSSGSQADSDAVDGTSQPSVDETADATVEETETPEEATSTATSPAEESTSGTATAEAIEAETAEAQPTATVADETPEAEPTATVAVETPESDSTNQLELESWLEDADYFFESREWLSALDYLKLLERSDSTFENDKVTDMLASTYIGLGNSQVLSASDTDSVNSDLLEGAVGYYQSALEQNPQIPRLQQLVGSLNAFLSNSNREADATKSSLSDALAAYAGTLLSQGDPCGAMEHITASVRIKYDAERFDLQKQIGARCPSLAGLILPEVSVSDIAGRIIYSSADGTGGSAIWMTDAAEDSESSLLLANGRNPAISSSGTLMAYRSDGPEGIRGYDLSNTLQLPQGRFIQYTYNPEDSLDSPPTWSPGGERIIFASTVSSDRVNRIYWANNNRSGDYRLVADGREPDWHPSQDLIVYKGADATGNRPGLWLMTSGGGDRRPITQNSGDTRPVWSSDGETVVFMSNRRDSDWEIYAVNTVSEEVTRLTDNSAQDGLPAVSPNGQFVAFLSNRDSGIWNIYVVPIRGGNAERLTAIEGTLPNWLEHSIQWVE